jgi:formate hydrogenlyase subunit 6/NADH:ubiquinone oxidoreductase subunit I
MQINETVGKIEPMDEWILPEINLERCTRCGLCVRYCPTSAVEMVETRPVIVRPQDCVYCGECEEICPADAIALSYQVEPISPRNDHNKRRSM